MKLSYSLLVPLLLVIWIAYSNGQIQWVKQAPPPLSSDGDDGISGSAGNHSAVISYKIVVRNETLDSYVCGAFIGNVSFGNITVQSINNETFQAFVAKYDANGTELWVNVFNSSSDSVCFALALVSDGGIYVGGEFRGNFSSLDELSGEGFTAEEVSQMDTVRGFLVKYDTNGSLVSFLAVGEDGNSTHVQALGSDSEDNVFVTGNFVGNISLGTFSLQAQPGYESVFIARFSDVDQDFVWANASSGNGSVVVYNLATNEDGYSCLIATFSGNATLDSSDPSDDESDDDGGDDSDQILVVVVQFDSNGTVEWFRVASTESALPYGIHIDSDRNCTAAGSFKEFFLLDPFSQVNVSDTGAFFVKFSSEGNTTVLKTSLGDEDDIFTGVTCSDDTGNCWVSGFFTHNLTIDGVAYGASSGNISGNSSAIDSLLLGDDDDGDDEFDSDDNRRAIVLKFDSEGNVVDYLAASPGNHSSAATSVANVDEEIWVTGVFDESLSLGTFNLTSPARLTLFVFRANSTDTNLSSDGSDEIM